MIWKDLPKISIWHLFNKIFKVLLINFKLTQMNYFIRFTKSTPMEGHHDDAVCHDIFAFCAVSDLWLVNWTRWTYILEVLQSGPPRLAPYHMQLMQAHHHTLLQHLITVGVLFTQTAPVDHFSANNFNENARQWWFLLYILPDSCVCAAVQVRITTLTKNQWHIGHRR